MKNWAYQTVQKIGDIINADILSRTAFAAQLAIPFYMAMAIWCGVTLWLSRSFSAWYNPMLWLALGWSLLLIVSYVAFLLVKDWFSRYSSGGEYYAITFLAFFVPVTVILCFIMGAATIFSGAVVMCSLMVGAIIYPFRLIIPAMFAVIPLWIIGTLVWFHIDYMPVFSTGQAVYFIICDMLAAGIYVLYGGVVIISLVTAWHSRESHSQQLSIVDPLTNLFNRRHIMNLLELELAQRRKQDAFISLVMLDLDHFKRINDTYGHQMGDHVLKASANALSASLRQQDQVGRYGGEEFLIILPATQPAEAEKVAERCREAISNISLSDAPGIDLSASLGVVTCRKQEASNINWLIDQADSAMYEAKRLGRNQTFAASVLANDPVVQSAG